MSNTIPRETSGALRRIFIAPGRVPPIAGRVPPIAGRVPPIAGRLPPVAGRVLPIAVLLALAQGCGDDNSSGADGGSNNNASSYCGNGVREGIEECDDGAQNSDTIPDACRTDCTLARCGDGVVDTDEACDNGPQNSDMVPDACRPSCLEAHCGDGVVDIGRGESCDDGNLETDDGCSAECLVEYCGNGVREAAEECDDGNYAPGDGCSALCRLEICGNGVTDPGEQCDDGGLLSRDGCSSGCMTEEPSFRKDGPESLPASRYAHGMAYDARRGKILMFGGTHFDGAAFTPLRDTWEWDGAWVRRTPKNIPPARSGHAMAYDAARERVLLFGGSSGQFSKRTDTWEWDGADWTLLTPANFPPGRSAHAMAFDAGRGRVVLFGGDSETGFMGDTWEWDGQAWAELQPASAPSARLGHFMTYHPARGTVILYGGNGSGGLTTDTWEWDGTAWTQLAPLGSPTCGSGGGAMTFDAARGEVFAFPSCGTWTWDGVTWTERAPAEAPHDRFNGRVAYHAARGKVVLFGGFYSEGSTFYLNDTWLWDGDSWAEQPAPPASPSHRSGHAMAYHATLGQTLLFGGSTPAPPSDPDTFHDDTWIWDGAAWQELGPSVRPPARSGHQMAFHASGGAVLLFGGESDGSTRWLGDTWEWDGQAWTERSFPSAPAGRSGHALAEDPERGVLVLFGGQVGDGPSQRAGDTWEWDGQAWTELLPALSPPPRRAHRMAYDPIGRRVILFGGQVWNGSETLEANDTWEWDGQAWTERLGFTPPRARMGHALLLDPAR
ncbi:MAG: DUF4215 domain-containing protein, partial [Polyangia bacterium]|nr:DUF4215 domain-containing protein [Polyangia bacterium]